MRPLAIVLTFVAGLAAWPVVAQTSSLVRAVVTSSAPTYTNGDIQPITQTEDGALRVSCS